MATNQGRNDCPDARNHHLYTECGTCGTIGQLTMTAGGALRRLTIEPFRPLFDDEHSANSTESDDQG